VLVSIGGQAYGSITEDYNTAMTLLSAGFATMYLNERLVFGMVPEDIEGGWWGCACACACACACMVWLTHLAARHALQPIPYLLASTACLAMLCHEPDDPLNLMIL
jgi:cellulose synthase/poly-beta-1,6-N-acetylglucosamine synthase-like glycosyltransferase